MTTEFAFLNLEAIAPSPTNPRKHFDPAKLTELTDSIKAAGVHQPILVRPLPGERLEDTEREVQFEIVSGERRWRASLDAGQTKIPAMVRTLDDAQVMEIQLVENLQRTDLSEIEEAEGYETLMERTGINADAVAVKIGKSRAYVYSRLKLLDLTPETKQALREGKIDASRAILIARIPDAALQTKALTEATHTDYHGAVPSLRAFQSWLRTNVMLRLADAPFNIADINLIPTAGSCHDCPKHTKYSPDLFSDTASTDTSDLCLDTACYRQKESAHALLLEEVEAQLASKTGSTGSNQVKPKESTLQDELKHLQRMVQSDTRLEILKAVTSATLDALMVADYDKLRSSHEEILRTWIAGKLETTAVWNVERVLGLTVTEDTEDAQRIKAVQQRFNTCRPEDLHRIAIVHMLYDEMPTLDQQEGNFYVLGAVANILCVNRDAIKKQVQAKVRAEFAPLIQAIQARIDAQSGKPVSATKPATNPVKRNPRINADAAHALIAAAMQQQDSAPAAFAIGQAVRVTSDTDRLRIKHHAYAAREGTILKPYDSDDGQWVVSFDYHNQRLFLTEELEAV